MGSRHSAMPPSSRTSVLQEPQRCQVSVRDSHHTQGLMHRWPGWTGSWEAAAHIAARHMDDRPRSSLRQLVTVPRALHPVRLGLARTCMVSGQEGLDSDLFKSPLKTPSVRI